MKSPKLYGNGPGADIPTGPKVGLRRDISRYPNREEIGASLGGEMETKVISNLKEALRTRIEEISFKNNTYYNEAFFAKSIEEDFVGWYEEYAVKRQIDFILRHCEVRPNSKVLDVACGHGKHAEFLSQRGHDVLATDISEQLVAYLNGKHGDRIAFEKRTFMEISYSELFDLVIVLGNSLSLIPEDEFATVLGKLKDSLKRAGWLFVELDNRDSFINNEAGKKCWNYYDNRWLVLSEHYYDSEGQLEKTRDICIDLQNIRVNQFLMTKSLYNHDELYNLFRRTGLSIRKSFGDWEGNEVTDESPSLLIVAKKEF